MKVDRRGARPAKGVGWRWLLAAMLPLQAVAMDIEIDISSQGRPVADAVVSLHGVRPQVARAGTRSVMDQRNNTFVPGVLPVQVETSVAFPNSDQIRHQVYSFSPAKRFELPLYAGVAAAPIRFDQAGVVVVGCNIHDGMIASVVVLDTPYFVKTTADGRARLSAPAGDYQLRVWHSRLRAPRSGQAVTLAQGKPGRREVVLDLAPPPPPRPGSDRLRALQEKLRRIKQP